MYPLIESIKLLQGKLCLLEYHEERMNRSLSALFGINRHPVDFKEIREATSGLDPSGRFKIRVNYGESAYRYEILPYSLKPVKSLLLLDDDQLDYSFKLADRSALKRLYDARMECDDILICRHGALTDSYYCNVALEKDGRWFTPDVPLLAGVKRAALLEEGHITEAELYVEDIPDMTRIRLFNAMIEFGEIELPITDIHIS